MCSLLGSVVWFIEAEDMTADFKAQHKTQLVQYVLVENKEQE